MDSEKAIKKDLLICLGVGILIEGIIFLTMSCIATFREALELFLLMIAISSFLGILTYMASIGNNSKNKKINEQS